MDYRSEATPKRFIELAHWTLNTATSTVSKRVMSAESITSSPARFGVGARITLSVMSDAYVALILGALDSVDRSGLVVETGDVSTYVSGSEERLLAFLTDLGEAVARTGHHASMAVHLFRGCPGAIVCERPGPKGPGPRVVHAPKGRQTGRWVAAEWALYPLVDPQPQAPLGDPTRSPGPNAEDSTARGIDAGQTSTPDHMRDIYAAIEYTVQNGTYVRSQHSATRLEGDLGAVLEGVVAGWCGVGRTVQHVTSHLTISINSPSHKQTTQAQGQGVGTQTA